MQADREARRYRLTISAIALFVLILAGVEVIAALQVDSRFLLRDGLEWGYDVLIFGLAALTFDRGPRIERFAGFALAFILFVAGLQTAFQIWLTIVRPPEIEVEAVTISAALIVVEGWLVVLALRPFHTSHNPVIEATWLSSRNDAITGSLYALLTLTARLAPMTWPQLGVDALTVFLCLRAAKQVWRDARAINLPETSKVPPAPDIKGNV